MNILGISAGAHDAAITLINSQGDIQFAAHAERYSRVKNDEKLNSKMFGDMLNYGFPSEIAFYERPLVKKTRQLYSGQYSELTKNWSVRKMLTDSAPWAPFKNLPIFKYNHHLSHAAAGFQTSPFNEAVVVVIDAIGEWDTITIWEASYNKEGKAQYKRLWRKMYPQSIGLMYSAFTSYVGLKPMEEEYILMGMAAFHPYIPYGDALEFSQRITGHPTNEIFDFSNNFHAGIPKEVEELIKGWTPHKIAMATQELTEQLISTVIGLARLKSKTPNLVYAGGVALNCTANRILGDYYDNFWIMPNPGDAGSSLGAAALRCGYKLNWKDAFLGHNIEGDYPVAGVVSELLTNKIVGVANGRAEFGPRALGNRSLLADPRGNDIKDKVNEIKKRQKFRPFAPVILEEYVHEYFDMPSGWSKSTYMQTTANCKEPRKFPAICHVDDTSRVQTVPADGSGIRMLLEHWHYWTGCPMLLNTSLNVRGEAMVNDRNDAERFEKLYGIKVLS